MPNLMNDAELIVEAKTGQQQDNQTPASQLSPSEREYRAMSPQAQHRKDMADIQAAQQQIGRDVANIKGGLNTLKGSVGAVGDTAGAVVRDVKRKTSADAGMFGAPSIIGRATQNIFEFPVFVSSSVPVDMATAVNALLEQTYASYLQMAISMNPVVDEASFRAGDVFGKLKTNTSRYLEYTDPEAMFYAHDAVHNEIDMDNVTCEFNMIDLSVSDAKVINEALDYQPLSEFDFFFEAVQKGNKKKDDDDDESPKERRLHEQKLRDQHDAAERDKVRDLEDKLDRKNERKYKQAQEIRAYRKDKREEAAEERAQQRHKQEDIAYGPQGKAMLDKMLAMRDNEIKKARNAREESQAVRDAEKHAADMKVKAPTLMDETKIQKLNTLKPLMMTVGVKVQTGGRISDMIDYVVGVKTHCRLIKADVLPEFAQYPSKEMNRLSKKVKWRAGELKFLDYFFGKKEKKQAAYDSRDPNRKWYHRLYELAHLKGSSGVAKKITGRRSVDGIIPNVSMVITKADVDNIEAETGIDLLKGSTAAAICAEMYMIGLVVVDVDAQSIKMLLPDIHKEYDVHSLASVNKQLATLDSANDVSREVFKLARGH